MAVHLLKLVFGLGFIFSQPQHPSTKKRTSRISEFGESYQRKNTLRSQAHQHRFPPFLPSSLVSLVLPPPSLPFFYRSVPSTSSAHRPPPPRPFPPLVNPSQPSPSFLPPCRRQSSGDLSTKPKSPRRLSSSPPNPTRLLIVSSTFLPSFSRSKLAARDQREG